MRTDIPERQSEVLQWIAAGLTKAAICKKLNCRPQTLESYLKKFVVDYKGNPNHKGERCESCKLTEWMGQKIPLELHHVDGDRFNNELVNLQVLCPNCHALTDNYSGRNKGN